MIKGMQNMGCWQYLPSMGVWQEGVPDPSRRFTGSITVVPKFAGTYANEPKFEGSVANEPKFEGTIAVNS
jgi:hypothetical protein